MSGGDPVAALVAKAIEKIEKDARRFDTLYYLDVISNKYRVMDLTAVSLCMENNLPIYIFNLMDKGSLKRAIQGGNIGTLIHN